MSYYRFPKYVSVAEKRAKAEKKIRQLKKKKPDIDPVIIEGRSIAHTWWGKSWNANLERYADYSNRIGRGRSYVRHRAVLDLQVDPGTVTALVQGSASRPYSVQVEIKPLSTKSWNAILYDCRGKLNSLQDLLEGRFPKALSHLFMEEGSGLFPAPREIQFSCSCPDWAYMCKHVAATLYAIGARLDRDPALFFQLRQVNLDDLVETALADATGRLLEKSVKESNDIIADANLGDVFGIDMDEMTDWEKAASPKGSKNETTKKTGKTTRLSKSRSNRRKKTEAADEKTRIMKLVQQANSGISAKELHEKSGISSVKIRNVLYQAHRKGKVQKVSRGIYAGQEPKKRLAPAEREAVVVSVIGAAKHGIRAPQIAEAAGISLTSARPVMVRLLKKGKIRRLSHGLYGPPLASRRHRPKSAINEILGMIGEHPDGISFSTLKAVSGCEEKKLRNIVFRLHQTGKIQRVERGVYTTTPGA